MDAKRFLSGALGIVLGLGILTSVAPAALLVDGHGNTVVGRANSVQRRLYRLAVDTKPKRRGPHVLAQVPPVKIINLTGASLANDRLPCWSYDGQRVFFVSNRSGDSRIWSMKIDGSDATQVTFGPGQDSYPAMSPGGDYLAYASNRFGSWDLFIRDIARGTEQRLTFWGDSDEIQPAWSPLGNEIAFATNRTNAGGRDHYHIWLVGTHSGLTRRLTDTIFEETQPAWNPTYPQIIAYTGTGPQGDRDVWLSVMGDPVPYQITTDPGEDFHPTWDPYGSEIAFASDRGGDNDLWRLPVVSVDYLTDEVLVTPEDPLLNPPENIFQYQPPRPKSDIDPSWAPANLFADGLPALMRIAFTSDQKGDNDIWLVSPDDFTPPNIDYNSDDSPRVQVTPQQSHPGEFVTITAAVQDNESGVARVYAAIKCADSPMSLPIEMDKVLEGAGNRSELRVPVDYLLIDANTGKPYNQVWAYDPSTLVYGPLGYPTFFDIPWGPVYTYYTRTLEARSTFVDHLLQLRDDGGASGSGDAVAGDGVYTAVWRIPPSSDNMNYNPASDYYVDIVAWDRAGNLETWYEYWYAWDTPPDTKSYSWTIPHPPNNDLPPEACFTTDRHYAMPGETINFDASCSFDPQAYQRTCKNDEGVCTECEYKIQGGFEDFPPTGIMPYYDPDYPLPNYEWDFGDGSVERHLPIASHAYTEPGIYTVTLTVWDSPRDSSHERRLTDISTTEITVVEDQTEIPDNLPPVVYLINEDVHNPQFDTTPDDPCDNLVSFDGSSAYDEDGDAIVLYEWDFDGNGFVDYAESPDDAPDGNFDGIYDPVGVSENGGVPFVYRSDPPNNAIYLVTLWVTDARGAVGSYTDWKYVGSLGGYSDATISTRYISYGINHIAGFTAREFPAGGPSPWLLINDYGCGQKSEVYEYEGTGGVMYMGDPLAYGWEPIYQIAEDAWTSSPYVVSQYQWPEDLTSPLLPRARFQAVDGHHLMSYAGDYALFSRLSGIIPRGIAAGFLTEPCDEWRILCRGPIDYTILEDYLPYEVTYPCGEVAGTTAIAAPKAVIWASPYAGDLRVQPGTITDPQSWVTLMKFLDNGGRLFMHGQDIAWALTKDGQFPNELLNDYFHVDMGDNDAYDRITAAADNGRYKLLGQLLNGYSITDNFWETHGENGSFDDVWTAGPYGDWAPHGDDNHWRGECAANQFWQDAVTAIEPGESLFEYDDPSNYPGREGSTAAVQYIDPDKGFRTVFSAVGFEGIQQRYYVNPGPVSRVIRSQLVHNIGDFLRTGVVTGTLRYRQTGGPVAGACVELIDDWGSSPTYGQVIGSTLSLADGGFSIEALPVTVFLLRITHDNQTVFYHPDRSATDGAYVTTLGVINLTKPAPGTISGRVLQLDGTTGIPGATVIFTSTLGDVFTTTTAIDGSYSVQVRAGTYTGVASAAGYASATRTGITVQQGEAKTGVNFMLGIPGNIGGTVTSAVDDSPIAGALIQVFVGATSVASTYTDEDGTYLIEGLAAGAYDVRASAAGFASQTYSGVPVFPLETITVDFQLQVVQPDIRYKWTAGIYLMSVPDDYSGPDDAPFDPADVLQYDRELLALSLATYMPTTSRYAFYPDPAADRLRVGRGYWLLLGTGETATISVDQPYTPNTADTTTVLVQAGWNTIGDPYSDEDGVAWGDIQVQIGSATPLSFTEAVNQGLIRRTLWGWNPATRTYFQTSSLLPWQGYWAKASQTLKLIIPKPTAGPGPPPPPPT
jgi:PKD repeat protein